MTKKLKESKKEGTVEINIKAVDRYMFGDLMLFYESDLQEENRRKENPFVEFGRHCRVKSGAVIGGDGFGYTKNDEGHYIHRKHHHKVIIGDDVDIGNCTTIDRGRWRDTQIGDGTKIDNQTHIGHNAVIGKNCLIHALVNICGSVEIGDDCEIFALTNIAPGIKICNNVIVGTHSFVNKDITLPGVYFGLPAVEQGVSEWNSEGEWEGV